MINLNFTIHAFEENIDTLKHLVKQCGIEIKEWNIHDDTFQSENCSKLQRSVIVIHCNGNSNCYDCCEGYSNLQANWIQYTNTASTSSDIKPLLLVLDNKAFVYCVKAYHENLKVSSFAFGSLAWPSHFFMHCEMNGTLSLYHDTKLLEIIFTTNFLRYILRLHYSNIREIYVTYRGHTPQDIFLLLVNPPLLYNIKERVFVIKHRRITLENETRILNIPHFLSTVVLGKSNALKISGLESVDIKEIVSRLHRRCGKIPVYYVAMKTSTLKNVENYFSDERDLHDFHCTYLLQAILRRNFVLHIQNMNCLSELVSSWNDFVRKNTNAMQKTLIDLLHLIDDGVIVDFRKYVATFFSCVLQNSSSDTARKNKFIIPPKTKMVARAVITPTRLILWPPELMPENRILRNFDPDFAMRVSFREDNFNKLSYQASFVSEDFFTEVIKCPLLKGIQIGDRHYKFLAWSNSQIRDHGIWMYARDSKQKDSQIIRNWMGDFSHIRNVSKYMARMGQCFSQTNNTVSVPVEKTKTVPDIKGKLPQSFCFSDGIGRISVALKEGVCKTLGVKRPCSAFQIRYAGYKGMLVVDPTLKDVDIVFRESMRKFQCTESKMLEIVKVAGPGPVFLNRQLITILDHHRVRKGVFLKLQETMLRTLTDMLLDEEQAANYLQSQSILNAVDFSNLARSGFALTIDVFFRNMLLALHRRDVDGIKNKARLAIEPSFGRNMFGVLDETGTLEYGQVFVQYTEDIGGNSEKTIVHTGPVLITKNPCMQPGDVRMLEAVHCSKLLHIRDCIVFPQKGPRPHPDEMSGSDLDGDEYVVIWQKDLFFTKNENAENFPHPHESLQFGPISLQDMVEFLCKYIRNDQLGSICSSHLAFANDKLYGLNDILCKELARKARIAVDFAKTGVEVKKDKTERPEKYPDFMEKGGTANSFRCTKALGVLYRTSRDFVLNNQFASMFYTNISCDPDMLYPGWEEYEESARSSLTCYNRLLEEILSTYGVANESEAMTKAFTKLHSRLQERRDRAEVEAMITSSVQTLWKNMKQEFWEEFCSNNLTECKDDEDLALGDQVLKKASAWYMVTYAQANPKFLSFPWIVAKQLALLKQRQLTERGIWPPPERPLLADLQSSIENSCISQTPLTSHEKQQLETSGTVPVETMISGFQIVKFWVERINEDYKTYYIEVGNLVKLFLQSTSQKPYGTVPKPAELFIDFLRYFLSLRFKSTPEADIFLSFRFGKTKRLGKMCMLYYHYIAIDGNFSSLKISRQPIYDDIEMEAQYISEATFIKYGKEGLEALLKSKSGVKGIHLRKNKRGKNYLLTAHGSPESIRSLVEFLQKDNALP